MDIVEEDEHVINWRKEDEDDAIVLSRRNRGGRFGGWTWHHLSVFMLTFFSYALFHASRKTLSTVKETISEEWTTNQWPGNRSLDPTQFPKHNHDVWTCGGDTGRRCLFSNGNDAQEFEGVLDACFLGAYAVGLYISGMLGDHYDPRIVLSTGMVLSAILVFLFGTVSQWLEVYHRSYYVIFWLASGLIQSSGWPTEVAVIGNWFGRGSRGLMLGIWSACASVGNIIGTELSAAFLHYGYEYTFLVNASMLFCGGIIIFFGLVSAPRDIGLPDPDEDTSSDTRMGPDPTERPKPVSFLRAVLLPGVIPYSVAYACLKLVNYSLFFWLPFYLTNKFGWEQSAADELSVYYDWGGIIGGIVGGIATDFMTHRTPVVIGLLVCSIGALFGYAHSPRNRLVNGFLLGVVGFFVGGPANLISAAVTADLGRQPEIRGNAEALSTVTGIIDGTGSVGAAVGQVLVTPIQQKFSWMAVFYLFMFMTICTILSLSPLLYKEIQGWIRGRNIPLTDSVYRRIAPDGQSPDDDPLLDDRSVGDGEGIFGAGAAVDDDEPQIH